MKAVVVKGRGLFEVSDVDKPAIGPGEVLVRITKASLCYRDILQLKGYYPRMRYPVVLGHEAVGVVEESLDPRFRPGERVVPILYSVDGVCDMCIRGEEVYCRSRLSYGEEVDGFFAQYAKVNANSLVKVPDYVDDYLASITPCVVAMVYKGLRRAGLRRGETVLVTGAGGGVGIHAVQVAKALGARVIAVTSHGEKAGELSNYADHVIVGPGFHDAAKALTDGGVDIVVEAVGTPTINESLRSLRQGGRLVLIGNVNPDEALNLRLGYVILKDIAIIGNIASNKSDVVEAFRLAKYIRAVKAGEYGLGEFQDALNQLMNQRRIGKIYINPW